MTDNKQLNWRHLKALNDLYRQGSSKAKVQDQPYIRFLISKRLISPKVGNHTILQANPAYNALYEEIFKETFEHFEAFFNTSDLLDDGRGRYTEHDIKTLIFIRDNKDELKKALSTQRTFSSQVFKGSKYLENKPGLKRAVCKLLEIDEFPDKDPKNNQMRLVVDCPNPKMIVLCENMNNLKMPWEKRKHNIELWYVGGNNIGIIDEIPDKYLELPLYYVCDWDYEGLRIYSRVKEKIERKSRSIVLLQPNDPKLALPVNSTYHNSEWIKDAEFSGLKRTDFSDKQQELITYLITNNLWIEEESYDLVNLLIQQNIIKVSHTNSYKLV
jgi:hypothetical protein